MKRIFHIEDTARVIVLEDNEERIAFFRETLPDSLIIRNPEAFFLALGIRNYFWCFLDHDVPSENDLNGAHVARVLAYMEFQGLVIVHSANMLGASRIEEILKRAGIHTDVIEFGGFEIGGRR
jgi:hypothetical protein